MVLKNTIYIKIGGKTKNRGKVEKVVIGRRSLVIGKAIGCVNLKVKS